jgi:glycosyltransferase involved in cell wall biosynthesis
MQALLTALALADVYDVELCGQHLPTPARFMETFGADASSLAFFELEARGLLRHVIGDRATIRRWRHAFIRWSHARQLAHRPADLLFRIDHAPPPRASHPASIYSCLFPFADETNVFSTRLADRAYIRVCRGLERVLLGDRDHSLATWSRFAANSEYTAGWMKKLWGVSADVIWPPCDDMGPAAAKEPWILSVGRFEPEAKTQHSKSQDVAIEAFRRLCERYDQPCELHLAGHAGTDAASVAYVERLREQAAGLPVFLHLSIDRSQLVELYRRSSVFWLATGSGYDPAHFPGKQEHFGVATVEAMSAGVVPVVHRSGGSIEIVEGRGFGALWETQEELVSATVDLLGDPARRAREAELATARARDFTPAAFLDSVRAIVAEVLDPSGNVTIESKRTVSGPAL